MLDFSLDSNQLYFRVWIGWPTWLPWFNNTWTWYKNWRFAKHSAADIQIECDWSCLFEIEFQINRRTSHSGLQLSVGLLKHWISFNWYDTRHWNDHKNRYYNDDDYDNMYYTIDDANKKIFELAQKIKGGVSDAELDKIIEDLPHYSWETAIVAKLAEWQYSTEINRLARLSWNKSLENAWWIDKKGQPKK